MEVKSGDHIRKLVITGALGALAIFLGITRLGFFPWISGASITILHIPAIIGAILEGPFVGTGIGAIFGLFSLLQAYIAPTGPVDPLFQNPLVSVLPRIVFPLVTWAIYTTMSRWAKIPAVIAASVAGTVVHTALVLSMLVLTDVTGILAKVTNSANGWVAAGAIFIANGLPEAAAAGILSTLILAAWLGFSSSGKKSKLSREK